MDVQENFVMCHLANLSNRISAAADKKITDSSLVFTDSKIALFCLLNTNAPPCH
jgi:hypothetical protein